MKIFTTLTRLALVATTLFFSQNLFAQWATTSTNIYNTNSGKVGIGMLPAFQGKLSIASDALTPHIWLTGGATFTSSNLLSKWNLKTSSGNGSLGLICSDASANNGYGLLSGADLASPIVWMYNSSLGGNAFTVALKTFGGDISSIDNYLTPLFQVRQNGNVLIGKTSQINSLYKLDIAGKVRADEIVVNTTGADFVFSNDYNLRPLSEVEKFIQENQHLPEIPSALEMQTEGASIGELQTKLLQKIEELTLYMIEMKKENEALKQEIQQLKTK